MEEWARLRQDFEKEAGRYHDLVAETYFVTQQGTMCREKAFTKPNHAILLYQYFGNASEENHPDLETPELSVFAVVSGSQTELFRKMAARAGSLLPGELRVTLLQAVVEKFLDKDKPGKPVHSLNSDPMAAWLMFILAGTATIHPNRMDGTALRVDPFSASLTAIDFILDSKKKASQTEKILEQSTTAISTDKTLNNTTPSAPVKKWYEKPIGYVLLTVVAGLIVAYIVFYLGWNVPKETKGQPLREQKPSVMPSSNIAQKAPAYALPSAKNGETMSQLPNLSVLDNKALVENKDEITDSIANTKTVSIKEGNSEPVFGGEVTISVIGISFEGEPLRHKVTAAIGCGNQKIINISKKDIGSVTTCKVKAVYTIRLISADTFYAGFRVDRKPI